MSFFYRFLAVLFLASLPYLTQAQQAPRYQYMHIYFTSGLQLGNAPVVVFSPALKGEKEVKVDMPPARKTSSDIPKTKVGTSNGDAWIRDADGKQRRQTPEEARLENAAQAQSQQQFRDDMSQWAERKQEALAKALNKAGADGWDVVQMTSPSAGYTVYLLRKPL